MARQAKRKVSPQLVVPCSQDGCRCTGTLDQMMLAPFSVIKHQNPDVKTKKDVRWHHFKPLCKEHSQYIAGCGTMRQACKEFGIKIPHASSNTGVGGPFSYGAASDGPF